MKGLPNVAIGWLGMMNNRMNLNDLRLNDELIKKVFLFPTPMCGTCGEIGAIKTSGKLSEIKEKMFKFIDDLKTEYDIDEAVYVTVPEGDKSNKMFILGRVKSKEDKPYVEYTDPNLLYDLVGPDYTTILHNLDELAVFCGLNSNTERDEDSQEAEPILADLLPYSQKYEYI